MYMTDQQRLSEARALALSLDKLTRSPKKFTPAAPWIIPATMIFVTLFALICLVIKLFMNYLSSKNNKSKTFGLSEASSPDIPTTPAEDQASMATTASMKTRGSFRHNSRRRNKPPPVSLYQIKQKQSPGGSATKSKTHKAAMKAISRAAKAEANRSLSRESTRQVDDNSDDNIKNSDDNSPTNLSHNSDDTDEIQVEQPGLAYAAARANLDQPDNPDDGPMSPSAGQPEVHIVQIRDLDDSVQQPAWPQAESEI